MPRSRSSALPRVRRQPWLVLLPASVPVVLLRAWAPAALPSVARRPDPPLAFPGAPWAHLRDVAGGPPRLNGAGGLQGLARGGQATLRGIEGRGAGYNANSYARNSYNSYGYGRSYRYGSYGSSDDGCYYVAIRRQAHSGL